MISVVAKNYGIHPQTLRLYEREGLLKPSRTEGNTRLYSEDDLRQLEVILNLTRDLGVNLAGVEIVLNMRRKLEQMQAEIGEFLRRAQGGAAAHEPRGLGGEAGAGARPHSAQPSGAQRSRTRAEAAYNLTSSSLPRRKAHDARPQEEEGRRAEDVAHRETEPRAGDRTGGGDSLNAYIREISRFKPLVRATTRRSSAGASSRVTRRRCSSWSRPTCASWSRTRSATAAWACTSSTSSTTARWASSRRPSASTPSATSSSSPTRCGGCARPSSTRCPSTRACSACPRSCRARSPRSATRASSSRPSWSGRPPPRSWPRRPASPRKRSRSC